MNITFILSKSLTIKNDAIWSILPYFGIFSHRSRGYKNEETKNAKPNLLSVCIDSVSHKLIS